MDGAAGAHSLFSDIFRSESKAESKADEEGVNAVDRAARCIRCSLEKLAGKLRPGMRTGEIAVKLQKILNSFRVDPGMIIRICPDEVAWHGLPGARRIRDGEIVTVDAACSVQGWWADAAVTFAVGEVNEERKRLMSAAVRAVNSAAAFIREGEDGTAAAGALKAVLREYDVRLIPEAAGHRVGRCLHDGPALTYDGRPYPPIAAGAVYTAEPVLTTGSGEVIIADDGSAVTADGAPTAHFELPVLALRKKGRILGSPESAL